MRRAGLLLSMLAMLLVALGGGAPALEAKGKDVEHLFAATLDGLPPAPSPVALARITFAPGSGLSMTANPGPALHFVEQGGFDVLMLGGGALERAGATTPAGATPVAAGEEFSIAPDDLLVIPANTPFEVYNTGAAPAVALIIEFFGRDLSQPLPEGILLEPLVVGEASLMPSVTSTVTLSRTMLQPNEAVPLAMPAAMAVGPTLTVIEEGEAGFLLKAGEAEVTNASGEATPSATPAASLTVPINQEVVLEAGDTIFAQADAQAGIRNVGTEPVSYLQLAILTP